MPATIQISQVILLISFLVAVYESYIRGGDVRMLGIAAVKYVGVGLVLLSYGGVFRDVNATFNAFADFVSNNTTGGVDVFETWMSDLWTFLQREGWRGFLDFVMGGAAAIVGGVLMIGGYLVYPLTYVAFCFFYSFYGTVLYVVGPIVISLLPAFGVGSTLARWKRAPAKLQD